MDFKALEIVGHSLDSLLDSFYTSFFSPRDFRWEECHRAPTPSEKGKHLIEVSAQFLKFSPSLS